MKNFPNQFNDIDKIRSTLQTILDLRIAGQDTNDDGVLGLAMVMNGTYAFRKTDPPTAFDDALKAELAKPKGSQGSRTAARELRRTLIALDWLDAYGEPTEDGLAFLHTTPASIEARNALQVALWDLEVVEPRPSHPFRIMLRLLGVAPSLHRQGLELALEAVDDSPAEWERVVALYKLTSEQRRTELNAAGVNDPTIVNAVKVFPTLGRSAGLVVDDGGTYSLSEEGKALVESYTGELTTSVVPVTTSGRLRARPGLRPTTADTAGYASPSTSGKALTEEEQAAARAKLTSRSLAHSVGLKQLAALLKPEGNMSEGSIDLFYRPADETLPALLIEFKTIRDDDHAQVRHALGQVLYYEYFDVMPLALPHGVHKVVATDRPLAPGLDAFLQNLGVASVYVSADGWVKRNALADQLATYFQVAPANAT